MIQTRIEATVADKVDVSAEDGLEGLLQSEHVKEIGTRRRLDEKVDIRIHAIIAARYGAESGELRETPSFGNLPKNRAPRRDQIARPRAVRALASNLIADCGLRHPEPFRDVALRVPVKKHRTHRKHAPQSRQFSVARCMLVLHE